MAGTPRKLSSFSVILVMVVLVIAGAAMIPLLNIQYTPTIRQQSLSIGFSWPNASAKVIEQEVTAKIEGLAAGIRGVENIRSVSRRGSGSIDLTLKKEANRDAVRFEVSSLVRRLYPTLPEGVAYPSLSTSTSGDRQRPVITYTLNAALPPQQILHYAENTISRRLGALTGVNAVQLSGAMPEYVEVRFRGEQLTRFGITPDRIAAEISRSTGRQTALGKMEAPDPSSGEAEQMIVLLNSGSVEQLESVPVAKTGERIVTLGEVAAVRIREMLPTSYYRINGLNTINVAVYPEKQINTLKLVESVKREMAAMESSFPESFSVLVVEDTSEYIKEELNKILIRTVLCVLILLGFVLAVSRNWRYLLVISVTLIANILVAFIFYNLFDLELHLYSLAGITVSLGIVIDTSIIMVDHYGYYRDRRVFIAILAALLTTVASLSVVFLLPEGQRMNLADFAAVIIINLVLSLGVAFLFIPALMDKIRIRQKIDNQRLRAKRRIVRISRRYRRLIRFERRHRWAFVVAIILAFGLPIHLLPTKLDAPRGGELNRAQEFYNKIIGSTLYQEKLKKPLEIALGGTFRLFHQGIQWSGYYREPQRPELIINAGMPEGCTVQQLDEVMRAMENFLAQYGEIELFRTRITSYNNGQIVVVFRPEVENTYFPVYLKSAVISRANNFGGATWSVYGIDEQSFNNNVVSAYKSQRIRLTGYNYDRLYAHAEALREVLAQNRRISEPGIYGEVSYGNSLVRSEYYIRFDPEKMALYGLDMAGVYATLNRRLANRSVGRIFTDGTLMNLTLTGDETESFDRWHLENQYIDVGGGSVRLADLGTIEKRQMGNDIYRENQQYRLFVAYDFVGPYELARRTMDNEVEALNARLPMGFLAKSESSSWSPGEAAKQYLLLVLITAIIYFIGAILFESLRQPLVVISLIPISFIGVFLTFYLTGFRFDQGGFAAFVLLCGIVVNAGFYVINEYNHTIRASGQSALRDYVKAFNHKIVPIGLTVVSTILGLIPFLFEGDTEVFWFSFAIGTMGGMAFSLVALFFYLPLFLPMKKQPFIPERT
jgi:multidrug efflux pump subunit AcrB